MRMLVGFFVVVTMLTTFLVGCGEQETLKVDRTETERTYREPMPNNPVYTSPLRTCLTHRSAFPSHADYCKALIKEEKDSRCKRKLGKNVYWISCNQ